MKWHRSRAKHLSIESHLGVQRHPSTATFLGPTEVEQEVSLPRPKSSGFGSKCQTLPLLPPPESSENCTILPSLTLSEHAAVCQSIISPTSKTAVCSARHPRMAIWKLPSRLVPTYLGQTPGLRDHLINVFDHKVASPQSANPLKLDLQWQALKHEQIFHSAGNGTPRYM